MVGNGPLEMGLVMVGNGVGNGWQWLVMGLVMVGNGW